MIKLTRPARPAELTVEFQQNQTDEFKRTGASVWREKFIIQGLLAMSFGKCAYCECRVTEESKYLEVEHFADKDTHKDRVLEWENLLPACKRCNVRKHSHDVILAPIVNPAIDDPRDHLHFAFYRFDGKGEVGRSTVEVLGLNDHDRLLLSRFQVGSKVAEVLADIGQLLRE